MIVKDPGHCYGVDAYSPSGEPTNRVMDIQFVKKIGERYPGNINFPLEGTNCQELLRVLIDRVSYLNRQQPSTHNITVLTILRRALTAFEIRAADLKGVPAKAVLDLVGFPIEAVKPCKCCGHIFPHTHTTPEESSS